MDMIGQFDELGIADACAGGGDLIVQSPLDGAEIARVASNTDADVEAALVNAERAFLAWREIPAPKRRRRDRCVTLFGFRGGLASFRCGGLGDPGRRLGF